MSRIFISYRREDSAGYAGRIYDRLNQHFGSDQIFMDIDNIRPGMDFVEVIEKAVGSCDVLIALMGKQWLAIKDAQGNRRLYNPNDFVRLEIKTALERNILVIPTLVQEASIPKAKELPEDLASLTRRNAIEISDSRFHKDMDRLINELDVVLGGLKKSATPKSRHQQYQTPQQGLKRWWRVWAILFGFFLLFLALAEGSFGYVRSILMIFLIPVPFLVVSIEHFINDRVTRGILFLIPLALLISEISPLEPYDVLPASIIVAINVLTSIALPIIFVSSIIDAFKNKPK